MDCCDWTGKTIFQRAGGGSVNGNPVFDNIAALSAFRVEASQNGLIAWVLSVEDAFVYQNDADLPSDQIVIVAPDAETSTGVWVRLLIPNERWGQRPGWYINANNGNDENDGTEGAPLRTHGELERRVRGLTIKQPTVITIMSHLDEVIRLDVNLSDVEPAGAITYVGTEVTAFLRSESAITSHIALKAMPETSSPGNTPLSITDTAHTNWVGDDTAAYPNLIGHRIRIVVNGDSGDTENHVGAAAWIARQEADAQVARLSPFMIDTTPIDPNDQDRYVVEDQWKVHGFDLTLRRRGRGAPVCVIRNLALTRNEPLFNTRLKSDNAEARYIVRDCMIHAAMIEIDRGNIENCLLRGSSSGAGFVLVGKSISIIGGLTLESGMVIETPSALFIGGDHLLQGNTAAPGVGMVVRAPVVELNGAAFFNYNPALVVHCGGAVRVGFETQAGAIGLWGADNGAADPVGAVAVIEPGAMLVYDSPTDGPSGGAAPVIAPVDGSVRFSVGNVNIGRTTDAQSPPFFNAGNGAGFVNRRGDGGGGA